MTPRSPERNREMRERSHEKILRAALEEFGETGFDGATLAAIAKRAGVSKGLAYNYFESKEEMLEAILDRRWRAVLELWERAATVSDPRERLRVVVGETLERARRSPEEARLHLALLGRASTVAALGRVKRRQGRRLGRWRELALDLLRDLADGSLEEPAAEVVFFTSVLNGLSLAVASQPRAADVQAMVRRVAAIYDRGGASGRTPGG